MDKIPLLLTGANGLVGSKFTQLYQHKYHFDNLDIHHPTQPVDITNTSAVNRAFKKSAAPAVIHLAAYTDVSGAWQQKGDRTGLAYQVNVAGTNNIVSACQEFNKFLIHISTAYVFAGEKQALYQETDQAQPIEWYGQTKFEAEQLIQKSGIKFAILRIDQPFRSDKFQRKDIAHKIIDGLKNDNLPPMFTNHYFGPTFIDDFAHILDFFVSSQTKGLFHAASGEQWTDFDFAQALKQIHHLPGKITRGDLNQYLQTLHRPYQKNTALDCSKLKKILPFNMNSIKEALALIEI